MPDRSRRRLLTHVSGILGFAAAGLGGCLSAPPERRLSLDAYATAAWPRPHRTPANDRIVRAATALSSQPTPAWYAATPSPVTAIAIAEGTLFAADSQGVTAVDAATGRQQWEIDLASGNQRRLEAVAGRLYVSDRTTVRALSADDGAVQWTFEASAPVAELLELDGIVYVSGQNGLIGLHAETGERGWHLEPATHSRLAAADDRVYWLTAIELAVLEPTTWHHPRLADGPERHHRWTWDRSQLPVSPVVVDETVYAGQDGHHLPRRERRGLSVNSRSVH